MEGYLKLKNIMDEYVALLDKLIAFEEKKLEAVKYAKIDELDRFLKEEQVHLLQFKGLDSKREKLQKELGFEGLTYKQIIAKTDGDLRQQLEDSFVVLENKTNHFKSLIRTISGCIDVKLHTIDATLEKFGAEPLAKPAQTTGIYDKINTDTSAPATGLRFKSTKA